MDLKPSWTFLDVAESEWVASNDLAFAIWDGFPVSPGHVLVVTRRVVEDWFAASDEERTAMMELVNVVREKLLCDLEPRPDGFNVGFNCGRSAGQTVMHVHVHVIPRYADDMPDPRGGVRHVIPGKGNYCAPPTPESKNEPSATLELKTGHPDSSHWADLAIRLQHSHEVDVVVSFIQPSGVNEIEDAVFAALERGAHIRILTGDYLHVTDPSALRRLMQWREVASEQNRAANFETRLYCLPSGSGAPESFHPKAWRLKGDDGTVMVVGSSNLSRAALRTGVEWNLIAAGPTEAAPVKEFSASFERLWCESQILTDDLIDEYAKNRRLAKLAHPEPEREDQPFVALPPRAWQQEALTRLGALRDEGYTEALIAVATGMGKTWLAAFDIVAVGGSLERCPRVLVIAHRYQILAQAEATLLPAMRDRWPEAESTWCVGSPARFGPSLALASIQKLSRPDVLAVLRDERFDYVLIDEVHHAEAPSYRKVMSALNAGFIIGLTATPERADGVDVARLFGDILAYQATVGDGIHDGSLVPFEYIGLKDDVDFQQIPWRSGKFDFEVLAQAVESSARMERLWKAWNDHPAERTIVFCVSKRHAIFVRNWLRARGVSAAAAFSGTGSDPVADAITDLASGRINALCAVDMFNEGLDIPAVDRVVMLRPTESKVVFLQQLGRGLRSSPNKMSLRVIDFVGNHRIFAARLVHLLALGNPNASSATLSDFIKGKPPTLPPGCLIEIEPEAIDLLKRFIPGGKSAAVAAYRMLRDETGRRPTPLELFNRGYLPRVAAVGFHSWFDFVREEGDLSSQEIKTLKLIGEWFATVESTAMFRSYKAVVLRVLLDTGWFWDQVPVIDLAARCRTYLHNHPRLRDDLPPTKEFPQPYAAEIEEWAAWWKTWPLTRWVNVQRGRQWFKFVGDNFASNFSVATEFRTTFESMTSELVDYRLAQYQSRPNAATATSFTGKVAYSQGNPILFIPTVEAAGGRPSGITEMVLPDGSEWNFRLVKVACNVASPKGSSGNQLGELLKEWFGPDAGVPGTNQRVRFENRAGRWHVWPERALAVQPIEAPPDRAIPLPTNIIQFPVAPEQGSGFVPVYNLEAAAGHWGPECAPHEIGWLELTDIKPAAGMFVALVRGKSMIPKIPDGSWCLFRPCPPGTRNNRILLVQFHSLGDPEDGGRFTVKNYQSTKSISEDGWEHQSIELVPLNPEIPRIAVTPEEAPEMTIVGEFVKVVGP